MGKLFVVLFFTACIVASECGIIQKIKDRLRKTEDVSEFDDDIIQLSIIQKIKDRLRRDEDIFETNEDSIQLGIIQKIKDKLRRGDEDITDQIQQGIIQKIKDRLRKVEEFVEDDDILQQGIIQKIKDRLRRGESIQHSIIQKIKDRLRKVNDVSDLDDEIIQMGIIQKIKDRLRREEEMIEDDEQQIQQSIIQKIKDRLRKSGDNNIVQQGIIQKIKDRLRKAEDIVSLEDEDIQQSIIQKIKDRLKKSDSQRCLQQDANDYLDKILENARQQIDEPLRLPPRSSFVELSEGRVWGFPTLHRNGPVEVICEENNTVVISAKLATDELKGRYTWTKEFHNKKREGFVLVKTNDFEANIELTVEQKTGEASHPQLTKFKIQRFKDLKVEMTGMGFITWALAEVTTMMSGVFQWAIARSVQGPLREALERELLDVSIN